MICSWRCRVDFVKPETRRDFTRKCSCRSCHLFLQFLDFFGFYKHQFYGITHPMEFFMGYPPQRLFEKQVRPTMCDGWPGIKPTWWCNKFNQQTYGYSVLKLSFWIWLRHLADPHWISLNIIWGPNDPIALKAKKQPGWWFESLWKILVNWDDEIPNIWENKKCFKPPTRRKQQTHPCYGQNVWYIPYGSCSSIHGNSLWNPYHGQIYRPY